MKEIKELLSDSDTYMFLPGEEDDNIHIQTSEYKNPGTKLNTSSMGDCYHIIIFKEGEEGIEHLDNFEAILTAPIEYMTRMIKEDWFGVICRKTTTSQEFVTNLVAKVQEV